MQRSNPANYWFYLDRHVALWAPRDDDASSETASSAGMTEKDMCHSLSIKRKLFVSIIFCLIAIISISYSASAESPEDPSIDDNIEETEEKLSDDQYPNGRHAHEINNRIKEIEDDVQGMAKSYNDGTVWESPHEDLEIGKKSKIGFLAYPLVAPSYLMRLVTWPVFILGDFLIKKHVISTLVDVFSNDERTLWIYPKIDLGFGSGFGGGVGLKHLDLFHQNYILSAFYQIHINLNQEAGVSIEKPDAFYLKDRPFAYKVGTAFVKHNETDFYGEGIRTSHGTRAKYGCDAVRTGGWLGYEFVENLMLRWHTYFIWNYSRNGDGGTKVTDRFPPSELTAFHKDLYYTNFGLSLTHDSRDSKVVTETGGLRKVVIERYQGLGTTNYDYNQYSLDVSQYFQAFMPRHVFILRTKWIFQQDTGGKGIPFYRLAKLDVNSPLRGFDYGRFTDRDSAVFNVEYRFPIWSFMDGQFFFDTGRVFHSPTDFSFKHFKYSGGGGIRFRTREYFLMRFQIAYGGEGAKFLLKTSQEF